MTATSGPTAAIGTDYLEKTWQQSYRGSERTYDFEGVVADGYPLLQKIPDVNEPASGYLWGDLAAHGKTYYHFGEFISTIFCDEARRANPQQGPMLPGRLFLRARPSPRASRFPPNGAGASTNGPGQFRSSRPTPPPSPNSSATLLQKPRTSTLPFPTRSALKYS